MESGFLVIIDLWVIVLFFYASRGVFWTV
ncbi:hypothetical protein Goshw_006418 [Gossypium schwendimanii]|uniref:Uncharacterized protein n=1 Tax=Gossypium schwendimanii TaxID=34291 RepID=A0A7J9M1A8_GOSSC|nr:hypothetical protein [Gossypium schwendimanii]